MKDVLDASVAVKWVLDEPNVERALFFRKEIETLEITHVIAPDIFPVEIAHVLSKGFRQKKLTAEEADAYLADLMTTLPELISSRQLLPRAFAIAQETRTGIYDALYLALGEAEGVSVVTADEGMAKLPFGVVLIENLPMPPADAERPPG
jgi:predicted nucleic acid-binding protein